MAFKAKKFHIGEAPHFESMMMKNLNFGLPSHQCLTENRVNILFINNVAICELCGEVICNIVNDSVSSFEYTKHFADSRNIAEEKVVA